MTVRQLLTGMSMLMAPDAPAGGGASGGGGTDGSGGGAVGGTPAAAAPSGKGGAAEDGGGDDGGDDGAGDDDGGLDDDGEGIDPNDDPDDLGEEEDEQDDEGEGEDDGAEDHQAEPDDLDDDALAQLTAPEPKQPEPEVPAVDQLAKLVADIKIPDDLEKQFEAIEKNYDKDIADVQRSLHATILKQQAALEAVLKQSQKADFERAYRAQEKQLREAETIKGWDAAVYGTFDSRSPEQLDNLMKLGRAATEARELALARGRELTREQAYRAAHMKLFPGRKVQTQTQQDARREVFNQARQTSRTRSPVGTRAGVRPAKGKGKARAGSPGDDIRAILAKERGGDDDE